MPKAIPSIFLFNDLFYESDKVMPTIDELYDRWFCEKDGENWNQLIVWYV